MSVHTRDPTRIHILWGVSQLSGGKVIPHCLPLTTGSFQPQFCLCLSRAVLRWVGHIVPRAGAGQECLSPAANTDPGAVTISRICLSGAPQDRLGQFWPHSPRELNPPSAPTALGELLEPSWSCGCRRGPSMLTGLQLHCASEDCSRGMQACNNLPGRALGLTWLFHASSTSRGCG